MLQNKGDPSPELADVSTRGVEVFRKHVWEEMSSGAVSYEEMMPGEGGGGKIFSAGMSRRPRRRGSSGRGGRTNGRRRIPPGSGFDRACAGRGGRLRGGLLAARGLLSLGGLALSAA